MAALRWQRFDSRYGETSKKKKKMNFLTAPSVAFSHILWYWSLAARTSRTRCYYTRVAGHVDEKLEKPIWLGKKYDNLRQPFVLAGGCRLSIIQQDQQLLPADVLLNALVSTDLHDVAINASICLRASQASIQSAGALGIATELQVPLEMGWK